MKKIFEYRYHFFLTPFGALTINDDGSVYKESMDYNLVFEKQIPPEPKILVFKAPKMVPEILSVIEKYNDVLSKLPKHFDNPGVIDGATEKLVLGNWKFEGSNIIHVEKVSDLSFESVLSLDKYERGTFYSAELQKVFREIKAVIDSYNHTEIILWQFEEPPRYLDNYDFSIEKYFPKNVLQIQTIKVGEQLPYNPFMSYEKKVVLTKIHKRITVYDLYYDLGDKCSGCGSEKKGDYLITEFINKGKKIPVLYKVEDIDEEQISVRLCAIEKKYLNKKSIKIQNKIQKILKNVTKDEILGPQLTKTAIREQNDEKIEKMTPKKRQAYEKKCEKNYRKIMKMLHKK